MVRGKRGRKRAHHFPPLGSYRFLSGSRDAAFPIGFAVHGSLRSL
jgi:hypothetical protein